MTTPADDNEVDASDQDEGSERGFFKTALFAGVAVGVLGAAGYGAWYFGWLSLPWEEQPVVKQAPLDPSPPEPTLALPEPQPAPAQPDSDWLALQRQQQQNLATLQDNQVSLQENQARFDRLFERQAAFDDDLTVIRRQLAALSESVGAHESIDPMFSRIFLEQVTFSQLQLAIQTRGSSHYLQTALSRLTTVANWRDRQWPGWSILLQLRDTSTNVLADHELADQLADRLALALALAAIPSNPTNEFKIRLWQGVQRVSLRLLHALITINTPETEALLLAADAGAWQEVLDRLDDNAITGDAMSATTHLLNPWYLALQQRLEADRLANNLGTQLAAVIW